MRERVALIDPDARMRKHVQRVLAADGVEAEGFAATDEILETGDAEWDALLVSDDRLDALGVCHGLVQRGKWLPVVAFGETPTPRRIVAFVRGGGFDYLGWPIDGASFRRSLAQLGPAEGDARRRAAEARVLLQTLSPREAEVLDAMADGLSNKEIGAALGISPRTVEIHRASLLSKLDARSSAQALRMFHEDALLNPSPTAFQAVEGSRSDELSRAKLFTST